MWSVYRGEGASLHTLRIGQAWFQLARPCAEPIGGVLERIPQGEHHRLGIRVQVLIGQCSNTFIAGITLEKILGPHGELLLIKLPRVFQADGGAG